MDKQEFNPTTLLVPFLRKLADNIEQKTLTNEQLFKVGEFFMAFLFQKEMAKAVDDTDEDFMKFLTLGWWIYKQVLQTNFPIE